MQNKLNSPSQENTVPENPFDQIILEPVPTFPPISGFWRRFFAWVVDTIIVMIAGEIIGIIFSSFLYSIGPYGRPIGLIFILPYFGIMNSKIGGGQTFGKRLMKIAVRNKNNEPIELWRSVIRSLLLESPALLNSWTISILFLALPALLFKGWAIPVIQNFFTTWFMLLLAFGLGGAILYTMVFNFKPRQGLHDLLMGTYVVHLPGKPVGSFFKTSRIHWVVSSVWIGIVAIGSLFIIAPSAQTVSTSLNSPIDYLLKDPRFFTVSINYNYDTCCGETRSSMNITVWYKGNISESEKQEVAKSIVKAILDKEEILYNYDEITVQILLKYEIGIANGSESFKIANSIEGWRKEIYQNSPSGFISLPMARSLEIP